jgi:integrase
MVTVAQQWIGTLTTTPTRAQILARHVAKGHGHFEHGAVQANTELALVRAAWRWGLYQERWTGGDPTAGIRKWKRPKRKRIGKLDELRNLLGYFEICATDTETRDRALFGIELFTGCRRGEARLARVDAITPYGELGRWQEGQDEDWRNIGGAGPLASDEVDSGLEGDMTGEQ